MNSFGRMALGAFARNSTQNRIVSTNTVTSEAIASRILALYASPVPASLPFSTTTAVSAHRPKFVKRPKKNFEHSVGMTNRKNRLSFITKDLAAADAEEMERYRMNDEMWPGDQTANDGTGEGDQTVKESVNALRTRATERILTVVEETLNARYQDQTSTIDDNSYMNTDASEMADPSIPVWSPESREKLRRSVGFLLKNGAVYPLDLTRFLTTGPNPHRFCYLPEDRVDEIVSTLVDVGLRDKALLSVMFYDDLKVFSHPVSKIHDSLEFLREEGVAMSETLPTILIDCPSLLADLDKDDWRKRKDWFDHHFTTRSFREFLITQPVVLSQPLEDVEQKFFYVYTEMGLDQKQMMECSLFFHNMDHIRCRHEFLVRCGVYKFPDPKQRVVNLNPHLRKILDFGEAHFVKLVPGMQLRDYRVFKRIYEMETLRELEREAEETPTPEEVAEEEAERERRRETLRAADGFFMPAGRKRSAKQRWKNKLRKARENGVADY